ncbi:hypothetical protein BY996DRAFT_4200436 [Phakopsora pachyrhizi]|uniref:Secreted protein n=1 Tax=Phakopsora pachyrhizi TaxID=170000 RepID=A0AAV0BIM0_PHAPC|nr:hypothetical protein BY996DRAFT_4200436 [Phakopsora pachyrhizi]CAH7686380.1 hypothetical protein PPACK8108_LOCUS21024 [Phakopsora pachyrhizi]
MPSSSSHNLTGASWFLALSFLRGVVWCNSTSLLRPAWIERRRALSSRRLGAISTVQQLKSHRLFQGRSHTVATRYGRRPTGLRRNNDTDQLSIESSLRRIRPQGARRHRSLATDLEISASPSTPSDQVTVNRWPNTTKTTEKLLKTTKTELIQLDKLRSVCSRTNNIELTKR